MWLPTRLILYRSTSIRKREFRYQSKLSASRGIEIYLNTQCPDTCKLYLSITLFVYQVDNWRLTTMQWLLSGKDVYRFHKSVILLIRLYGVSWWSWFRFFWCNRHINLILFQSAMVLPFGLGALSYIYYHKTQRQLQENQLHNDSPILHGQLSKV